MGTALGSIAGGIFSLIQGGPDSGPRQSTRQAAEGVIQGYRGTAPHSLALSELYQPQYLGLGSQNLEQLLFGAPAAETESGLSYTMKNGKLVPVYGAKTSTPARRGLLDMLGEAAPKLDELSARSNTYARTQNLSDLKTLLPQAQDAYKEANPELAGLRDQIFGDASKQLKLGSQINPEDAYRISQGVRGDFANRGFGGNQPGGQFAEALQLYGGGEQLRTGRQNYALNSLNSLYQTAPDYARLILGEQGQFGNTANFITGQEPLAYQGNNYDPYNPSGVQASINGSNLAWQGKQAMTQAVQGIGNGVGQLAAGAFGGGGFSGAGMMGAMG